MNEIWDNPLVKMQDRLEMAGGAYKWMEKVANTQRFRKNLAEARVKELEDALRIVAEWQLPSTGAFWDDEKTRPVSYEAEYGSQGAKRYIQGIALKALNDVQPVQHHPV